MSADNYRSLLTTVITLHGDRLISTALSIIIGAGYSSCSLMAWLNRVSAYGRNYGDPRTPSQITTRFFSKKRKKISLRYVHIHCKSKKTCIH